MANIYEPTEEQKALYAEFVATRPEAVRLVAERFPPWTLYRIKGSGHRCHVYSFGEAEDGSVSLTVSVTGQFNAVMFDRNVFGISPEDLEECELPSADEATGTLMSPEAVDENIDAMRVMVRPDLFEMGPAGKAIRKEVNG